MLIECLSSFRQSVSALLFAVLWADLHGRFSRPYNRDPVNVDQDVDDPWPLEVYGHDGVAVNITMEPGDMVRDSRVHYVGCSKDTP
jgi:hypothetical protein